MKVDRWDQIWIFLSLDITERFRRELLLPSAIGPEQRIAIRARLRQFVLEREPLAAGVMSIFKTVDPNLASDAETVYLWGEHLYLYDGPDRADETIWRLTSYWLQSGRFAKAQDWVYELMDHLRTDQDAREKLLRKKLIQMRSDGLSAWDSEWVVRSFGETDAVFTTVDLISRYNSFLLSWNKICTDLPEDKLDHLFSVAIEVAKQDQFPHAVPFPDSWRLKSERFLHLNK
jgi:hypothetical protein